MFNYKDYPLELKMFRATVMKAKMMQYQCQNNRNNHKWLQYVNSTRNRFMFAGWVIHSFYAERDLTAAIVTAEMGISRKAVDEMVNDWEAEGWLYKEKGTGINVHKVFLHPSDEVLHINDEWFQWYEDSILPMIIKAHTFYNSRDIDLKSLQNDSQFTTNSGSNLSSLEEGVSSFILNGSRKLREGKDIPSSASAYELNAWYREKVKKDKVKKVK